MAGNIKQKQKEVTRNGYKAARENKLFPRELQNSDKWEDAQLGTYGAKNTTRQQQNFSREHMMGHSKAIADLANSKRQKTQNREVNTRRVLEDAFKNKSGARKLKK